MATEAARETSLGASRDGHLLLDARNLVKAFGGIRAIDGLSLSLRRGEVRCIIGPNGAGKSTFFRLLMGIYRPDAGSIHFQGGEITRSHPFERARLGIGMKWQTLGIYPDLSVRHNVMIALRRTAKGEDTERDVEEMLARVSLSGKGDELARHLSHGQQQWLEIGMALAMKPQLLLLDEPTAGLSREETRATGEMVMEINAQGITAVVTEHDMAFVRQLDSPITVLHHGRVFAEGSHREIEQREDVRRIYLGATYQDG